MKNTTPPRIQISIPSSLDDEDSPATGVVKHDSMEDDEDDDEEEQEFDSPPKALVTPSTKTNGKVNVANNNNKKNDSSLLEFPINVECTSLCVSPSGNFVWGGFSDGTIRVFDASGKFLKDNDDESMLRRPNSNKTHLFVASKWCQTFGAVACQIHARGVHTDLLTHVAHDEEGDYVFGGVQRGAMEVYAINVQALEKTTSHMHGRRSCSSSHNNKNILDCLKVHVHSDAKLKGFGACTKLVDMPRPTYLLLTGTGIKNIHIWKFQPPLLGGNDDPNGIWEQLYDTQTNGNTINLLSFYRDLSTHKLWGVSKSGAQKLRLWDLTSEEDEQDTESTAANTRPKRPPYQDVENSRSALGVAGGFCVCGGGPTMYNQLSIVSLDQPKSNYNHTELELPGAAPASRGRRRGNLKQVSNVAVTSKEPHHALLELDDGSMVHYSASAAAAATVVSSELVPNRPADFWRRTFCLGRAANSILVAMSLYNPNTQQGRIVVRTLVKGPPPSKVLSPETADVRALQSLCMQGPALTPKQPSTRLFEDDSPAPALAKKQKLESKQPVDENGDESKAMESSTDVIIKTPSPTNLPKKKRKKRKAVSDGSTDDQKNKVAKFVTPKQGQQQSTSTHTSSMATTPISKLVVPQSTAKSKSPIEKQNSEQQNESPKAVLDNKKATSDVDLAMVTQVSPEQKEVSPPSAPPTPMEEEEGDITKFLQPKRVLNPAASSSSETLQENRKISPVTTKPQQVGEKAKDSSAKKATTLFSKKSGKPAVSMESQTRPASLGKEPQKHAKQSTTKQESGVLPAKTQVKKMTTKQTVDVSDRKTKAERLQRGDAHLKPVKKVTSKQSADWIKAAKPEKHVIQGDGKENRDAKAKQLLKVEKLKQPPKANTESNMNELKKAQKATLLESAKRSNSSSPELPLSAKDGSMLKKKRKLNKDKSTTSVRKQPPSIKATSVEPKRLIAAMTPERASKEKPEADIANILCELKTSPGPSKSKSPESSQSPLNRSITKTREEVIGELIVKQHKRLLVELNQITADSQARLAKRFEKFEPLTDAFSSSEEASRKKLAAEHLAAHSMIRKRLLRDAERTLRLAMDNPLSIEEARSELKASIRSYEEVVYDTLQRQELEAHCLAGVQTRARNGSIAPDVEVSFPFQASFRLVEKIHDALDPPKRAPGRPRSSKADA